MSYTTNRGSPQPLGANLQGNALNFALHAPAAKNVWLRLHDEKLPMERTGPVWHIALEDASLPIEYQYIVTNSTDAETPIFDPFNPYIASSTEWGQQIHPQNAARSVAMTPPPFDWMGISPPKYPEEKLIIYEMHIRGFTRDESSGVKEAGTFCGAIEKIPYLQQLGITAVELLPIQAFNESELTRKHCETGELLTNYWGYSPINYFSIMNRYLSKENNVNEFKEFVRELHRAGIQVILDVVYNHTGAPCPLPICDNDYYIMDNGAHTNYSGCGNSIHANSPPSTHLILESLRFLVTEYHIDGFRFDLASTLTRDDTGEPLQSPPIIEAMRADPILGKTTLISEPWDPGGLYQVGSFPCDFLDWNGSFRDVGRQYLNKMSVAIDSVKDALSGSPSLFNSKSPDKSINFITAHDGFSMIDLVSYESKHNIENGEKNQDGTDLNFSINLGHEGDDPNLYNERKKRVKNYALFLMVARGIPMFVMGDEVGFSHGGNNNPWCQDSPVNWLNWKSMDSELLETFKELIALRKKLKTSEACTWIDQSTRDVLVMMQNSEIGPLIIAFNPTESPVALTLPEGEWSLLFTTGEYTPPTLGGASSVVLQKNQ